MKYLIEAAQFYEAIHERGYFAANKESDMSDRLERFKKRYILTNIFLGQFEKALRLSQGDPQMLKITSDLVKRSSQLQFEAVETEFSHVLVVTSKELSSRYCLLHLLLDFCKQRGTDRSVVRITLQGPSYFELNAALASLISAHSRILVLVEWASFDISHEDLQSVMRRGAQIALLSLLANRVLISHDPLVCKIIELSKETL